ncbi:MAG: mannose-6-phosphate isomerase [Anaerolineae bacterium]|nr:MAG: mannose-6-phosphate isomerase [Anaerolineae bacterium]
MLNQPLQLVPEYRDYVWGGNRLRPGIVPTAEAWVVYESNLIADGLFAGQTLGQLAAEKGQALLGTRPYAKTGTRFPLLVKLLDCAQWLSLQVHPDDEQAVALEGPGQFGKTEAWHVIEAAPNATLIAGMKSGTTPEILQTAIRSGTIIEHAQFLNVRTGDTIFMPAGTIHALGPGLLIYEVQQTSDWTYRVYDWGRPETPTRRLHIEKSLAVSRPEASSSALPLPALSDGQPALLCDSPYFRLETVYAHTQPVVFDTQGESFHAITILEGTAHLVTSGGAVTLGRFETALVPAACGTYHLEPVTPYRALRTGVL